MDEFELPGLVGIGNVIRWFERNLATLSGVILVAGLTIALVDLLTAGKLLDNNPNLLYIWAVSQAVGVDAQFIGAADQLGQALRKHKWLVALGYFTLCLAMGYVGYIASAVFAMQQTYHLTTAQALQHMGMTSDTWLYQRAALSAVLVFLSGVLRYAAPKIKQVIDVEAEKARLEAEILLEPLRAKRNALKAGGLRTAGMSLLGRAEETPAVREVELVQPSVPTPLPDKVTPLHRPGTTKAIVTAYLDQHPRVSVNSLVQRFGGDPDVIVGWHREWLADRKKRDRDEIERLEAQLATMAAS